MPRVVPGQTWTVLIGLLGAVEARRDGASVPLGGLRVRGLLARLALDAGHPVAVPTLVLDSRGSTDDLTGMAAVAASLLPDARHRSLPGGWHGVPDDVLAEAILGFAQPHMPGS